MLALAASAASLAAAASRVPQTVMWEGSFLRQTQIALSMSKTSPLQPALDALLGYADHWEAEARGNRTFSVMVSGRPGSGRARAASAASPRSMTRSSDREHEATWPAPRSRPAPSPPLIRPRRLPPPQLKPEAGPSGDKHDFYSLGTYWWPNPNTSSGLPYVRRDGLVNPETEKYDSTPISQMIFAVKNLSLAYYFTGRPQYCAGAVDFIDAWFLEEATRMNPKSGLQYAQLLRGRDKGRGIGIIDAKDLAFVPDSALLLDGCAAWPAAKAAALRTWLEDYVVWLSSSPHAADEFAQVNNHGTWFDVQALSLSLHVGNTSWSKALAGNAMRRVRDQVAANGTLPLELARTRAMHYTWWDMIAFFELAHLAKRGGVDLFRYSAAPGVSLRHALDWIAPWTLNNCTAPWPYSELTPFDHGKFFQVYRMASINYGRGSGYEELIPMLEMPGSCVNYTTNHLNLVWPKL